jgi:hypothetical protein
MSFCCTFGCQKSVANRNLPGVNECMRSLRKAVHKTEFSESNFLAQVPDTAMLAVVVDVHQVERMGNSTTIGSPA